MGIVFQCDVSAPEVANITMKVQSNHWEISVNATLFIGNILKLFPAGRVLAHQSLNQMH
jgi:hypothetical protein